MIRAKEDTKECYLKSMGQWRIKQGAKDFCFSYVSVTWLL